MELSPQWQELTTRFLDARWANLMMDLYLYQQSGHPVYPGVDQGKILKGLIEHPNPHAIKVVILGQDPYASEASTGRAWAVAPGAKVPAALKNMALELAADTGEKLKDFTLDHWVAQGVCLVNSIPIAGSVPGQLGCDAAMERNLRSYEKLLRNLMVYLASEGRTVFVGLGREAEDRIRAWTEFYSGNSIVVAAHPSALSARRGFFGSKIFSRVNELLGAAGMEPIVWGNQ